MIRIWTVILDALLISWVCGVGPLCWIVRDGLGPRAVDSEGVFALQRFLMTFYWGPVLVLLIVLRVVATWQLKARKTTDDDMAPRRDFP